MIDLKTVCHMNTRNAIRSLTVCSLLLFGGCQDTTEAPVGTLDDLTPFAKEFLGMRNGTINSLAATGNRSVNMGFQGVANTVASMTGSSVASSDSSLVDPGPWITCGAITETNNPDGSTTVVTDYGDGCEEGFGEYRYLLFGKNTSTYRNSSSQSGTTFTYEFFSRYVSERFGSTYYYDMDTDGTPDTTTWIMDGHSTYSGYSSYDTATQQFSGSYSFSDTSDYQYDNETYSSRTEGINTYNHLQSVTTKNTYEYRQGESFYRSEVITPLVTSYTCSPAWDEPGIALCPMWLVYVSGRERVTYTQEGKSGQFEIDYGDGTCDNIIHIYEDGKVVRIDLSRDLGILMKN